MRMTVIGLFFVLVLTGGCQSIGTQPVSKQEALRRCGAVSPGTPGAIVAGTDNEFFTASSRQSLEIKPGIDSKTGAGPDGKAHTLTLIGRDNTLNLNQEAGEG